MAIFFYESTLSCDNLISSQDLPIIELLTGPLPEFVDTKLLTAPKKTLSFRMPVEKRVRYATDADRLEAKRKRNREWAARHPEVSRKWHAADGAKRARQKAVEKSLPCYEDSDYDSLDYD